MVFHWRLSDRYIAFALTFTMSSRMLINFCWRLTHNCLFSQTKIRKIRSWVSELSRSIPSHLSKYIWNGCLSDWLYRYNWIMHFHILIQFTWLLVYVPVNMYWHRLIEKKYIIYLNVLNYMNTFLSVCRYRIIYLPSCVIVLYMSTCLSVYLHLQIWLSVWISSLDLFWLCDTNVSMSLFLHTCGWLYVYA